MHIDKIDELLNNIIDDFYNKIMNKDKTTNKYFSEINFVKFQKDINELLLEYISKIDITSITKLVKNTNNVTTIYELIKRYIAFYFFLFIGSLYSGKIETYINNIVEFSRNQISYNLKISNFFNSENNALLIKMVKITRNIIEILKLDQEKKSLYSKKPEYKEAFEFVNSFNETIIKKSFSSSLPKKELSHNVIKSIIILLIYVKSEKKDIHKLIEDVETSEGEYIFIDVIYPTKQFIDYSSVENALSKRDIIQGISYEFWKYIKENQKLDILKSELLTVEDKILHLIDSNILIPIVDDFLLYHKDSERYDRFSNNIAEKKKKEDTKINFIVNKLDTISDYYSDLSKKDNKIRYEIKKNFYVPLSNRKAVLVNRNEEVKIISKLVNQGSKSLGNNDYISDLAYYRQYPYVNFRDFEKDGFPILLKTDKPTIDLIRRVNFEEGENKQKNKSYLQLRVGANDSIVNIIGFALLPKNKEKPLECLKIKDMINIRKNKEDNGALEINNYLIETNLLTKKAKSSVVWLFNTDQDSLEMGTYEQTNKLSQSEQLKILIAKLYDNIINEIFNNINLYLDREETIPIYRSLKYIDTYLDKNRDIKNNSLYDDLLEKVYFEKSPVTDSTYDIKEDIFHGIIGDIIKLPSAPNSKDNKIPILKIALSKSIDKYIKEESEEGEEELNIGVCQHNISWENIFSLRKSNPNKYSDLLYEFILQYVIENNDGDYVCKSCGILVNLKKYILDGAYDSDTNRYITFSTPMDVLLEDLPEYEKFRVSIRSIDKLVEKISIIANIPYFIGSNSLIRTRRRNIVKDTIDFIDSNNKFLKKNIKEHNILAQKSGISKDLSNLFLFELDNGIFVFSSKEKDYYKKIKVNNVIAYMVILMILEINETHITFIGGDNKSLCNFSVFDKYGHVLFDGLKIIINKSLETAPIKNYKILCFLIYIISCMATKYSVWYYEEEDNAKKKTKTKKFNPLIQKIIIHTILDILNSIIENSINEKAGRIYEVFISKFFLKLNTTFSSEDLLNKFRSDERYSAINEKKAYVLTKNPPVELAGIYKNPEYKEAPFMRNRLPKYEISLKNITFDKYYNINNITNCENGSNHNWKSEGKVIKCTLCEAILDELNYDSKKSDEILNNFTYIRLRKIATKICIVDANRHEYLYNEKEGISRCVKCNREETYKYSKKELDDLDNIINQKKIDMTIDKIKISKTQDTKDIENTDKYSLDVIDKITKEYNKIKNNQYIDDFINTLKNILGTDNIQENNIYLKDNIYIINHDHYGHSLDKPILISEKENKILFKKNHSFFNTDVLYYISSKGTKTEIYYDAINYILLGYKEINKNYVSMKNPEKKLIINYSIYNKLKIMGIPSKFINLSKIQTEQIYEELILNEPNYINKNMQLLEGLKYIIRNRTLNIKKIIYEFQRLINKIRYNVSLPVKKDKYEDERKEEEKEIDLLNELLEKYRKKLQNIQLYDANKEHKVFKHWKAIYNYVPKNPIQEEIKLDNIISSDDITLVDHFGNSILYYIISEFTKLLNYNTNKYLKTLISNLLIEFINIIFNLFNIESLNSNLDYQRFTVSLQSSMYMQNIEEQHSLDNIVSGIYDEYKEEEKPDQEDSNKEEKEEKEEKEDNEEEAQALDIDVDMEDFDKDVDGELDYQSINEGDMSRLVFLETNYYWK
jgi:hypothetical protein